MRKSMHELLVIVSIRDDRNQMEHGDGMENRTYQTAQCVTATLHGLKGDATRVYTFIEMIKCMHV